MDNSQKKIKWYVLSFMCFSTLWGFGNVANGFMYFNGIQVIFSWILMFALYFVPYALMVGEMGSAFKDLGGGVTSWVSETSGKKIAYYAGWTYFAVHITYIASKSTGGLKALSWMVFQNAEMLNLSLKKSRNHVQNVVQKFKLEKPKERENIIYVRIIQSHVIIFRGQNQERNHKSLTRN